MIRRNIIGRSTNASRPEQATVPFTFLGRTWLKHDDHELELRCLYGAWETPDPSWDYLDGAAIDARRPWHAPEYDWRGGAAALPVTCRSRPRWLTWACRRAGFHTAPALIRSRCR
jgi:hypothetical protein